MSSIVTGEAVVLELRPASFASRALSALIDVAAQLLLLVLIFIAVGSAIGSVDEALLRALLIGLLVLVLVAAPVTVETLSRGKSLGRLVMGLRIVRDDGGSIRFRHAFIRGVLAVLEIYMLFGSLAFMVAVFNDRSKRLGDILAGTYAMRERVRAEPELLITAPPELRPWLQLADLGRLPDALARRMSRFLRQAPRMMAPSRARLGAELATEALAFIAPPPPAGTSAERFLAAVIAERRDRDYRLLLGQRARAEETARRLHRLPFDR